MRGILNWLLQLFTNLPHKFIKYTWINTNITIQFSDNTYIFTTKPFNSITKPQWLSAIFHTSGKEFDFTTFTLRDQTDGVGHYFIISSPIGPRWR